MRIDGEVVIEKVFDSLDFPTPLVVCQKLSEFTEPLEGKKIKDASAGEGTGGEACELPPPDDK